VTSRYDEETTSRRLHVLHVCAPGSGGAANVALGYVRDQVARGWNVSVACSSHGFLGYDATSWFEPVPLKPHPDGEPVDATAGFMLFDTVLAFDHVQHRILIIANARITPDDDLEAIRGLDAVMLGAVGTPEVPPGVIERGLLLRLRFELDLYVNLRPFAAPASALKDGVDMIVSRENHEGTLAGGGG